MKIENLIITSVLLLFPIKNIMALPVDEIITNYTSSLNLRKTKIPNTTQAENRIASSEYCLLDDLAISQIEDGLLREVQQNILTLNFEGLKKLNFNNILGANSIQKKPIRTMESVYEFEWTNTKNATLKERLDNYSSINYAELKVTDYLIDPVNRVPGGNGFSETVLKIRVDIRGKDKSKYLTQDKLVLSVKLVKQNDWKIQDVNVLKGSTLVQNGSPSFEDVTQSSGLDKVSINLRTEAIRRGGYALSVTDYNNDKIPDIFVGHRENAEFFIGDKQGAFKKIETPFDKEKYSKTAVFADFNNSGKNDAVINRFIATDANGKKIENSFYPLQVAYYLNKDGKFIEQSNKFGEPDKHKKPMPSAIADFNGDGLLDIYIGYPGVQDFSQFGEPTKSLLGFQGLYINNKNGGFFDSTKSLSVADQRASYDAHLFPHSSLAIDLNQDQKMDLVVLDDRGNLSPAFINTGGGNFKESSKKIGLSNFSYAMAISSGDINNDGLVDIAMTNVNFSEMSRINIACNKHRSRELFYVDTKGLRVFESEGLNGSFKELDTEIFDDPGDGVGGVTFIDYNNDGLLDIYVVNGLWSGSKDGQNLGSFFSSAIFGSTKRQSNTLSERNDLKFMDVLRDFKGKILNYSLESSIVPGTEHPSLAGFQRNRLYRNNGNGSFTDVAYLEGVDSIADGYVVGKLDYNQDGKVDLVLRNADPGTENYKFPAVQLFKNNSKNSEKKSVFLTFEGVKSNRGGIGLFVKAYAKGWQQVSHLEGNSGSMQQQHFVHFGLGKNKALDYIEIFWPSGLKQVIKNLGPGYHHIVESGDSLAKGNNP